MYVCKSRNRRAYRKMETIKNATPLESGMHPHPAFELTMGVAHPGKTKKLKPTPMFRTLFWRSWSSAVPEAFVILPVYHGQAQGPARTIELSLSGANIRGHQ
jgi:hypothetical protein